MEKRETRGSKVEGEWGGGCFMMFKQEKEGRKYGRKVEGEGGGL